MKERAFPPLFGNPATRFERQRGFQKQRFRQGGCLSLSSTFEIFLTPGDRFQILSVEARHPRGWYPAFAGLNLYNGMGKIFLIRKSDRIILQKYGKRVALFSVQVKEEGPFPFEAGL